MLEGVGLGRARPSFLTACLSQGAYPRSPPARIRRTVRDPVRGMASVARGSGLEGGALRDDALGRIASERHQQLAGKRHDHDPTDPPTCLPDALPEPGAQGGVRLMAEPEPGELDQGVAQAAVAAL